jgi:hypothetical protein
MIKTMLNLGSLDPLPLCAVVEHLVRGVIALLWMFPEQSSVFS